MADILYRPKGNGTTPPNNPCDDCHFRIHNPLNPLDHGVVPSDAFGKLFKFNDSTGLPEACPFGIADTNAVRIDDADATAGQWCKFTANGIEGVSTPSLTDEKVKYDVGDTVAGYLADKIIAGTNVTVEEGTGADENKLKISASGSATDEKVKYDAGDPTAGYVSDKFVAGTGITLSEGTGGDENKLKITNSAPASAETDPIVGAVTGFVIANGAGVIGAAVSGTDIKTINSTSLLGSGDISLQTPLTFGIADTNKVQINAADVADNDYAKFTATGLEGRSYAEVLSDIGAQAAGSYLTDAPADGTTYGRKNNEWSDVGGAAGANTALSNLAAVAINTSLISDTDSTDDLGSSTKYWANLYVDTIYTPAINGGAAANDDITIQGTTDVTRTTSYVILQPTAGNVGISTATPLTRLDLGASLTTNSLLKFGAGELGSEAANRAYFYLNAYYDTTAKYRADGVAASFSLNDSYLYFANAITGVAGNTITWRTFLKIGGSGSDCLGIETVAPLTRLDLGSSINTNSMFRAGSLEMGSAAINSSYIGDNLYINSGLSKYRANGNAIVAQFLNGIFYLYNAVVGNAGDSITWRNFLKLGQSGSDCLGIETVTPLTRLDLGASLTTNSLFKAGTFEIQSYSINNGWLVDNGYFNGSNLIYRANGYITFMQFYNGGLIIDTAASGTAGAVATHPHRFTLLNSGNIGIGVDTPTAVLHLKAGTATANTAPLKFTSGTLLSASVAGAVEFLTDDYFVTITTGAARKGIVLDDGARLTSGKMPIATTNGRLVDVTPQTELTDELTTITCSAPGTPDYAIADPVQNTGYGFSTSDEMLSALKVIANCQARINELETKLVALGLLADAD